MNQLNRLLEIMARLRDPQQGCPWDLKQDFNSLVPYTIEETYEVAEAIEAGNKDAIKKELGDLLFQIVFYAQLASEEQVFDFEDIARAISEKMIHRHPHVFAGESYEDEASLHKAWQEHKEREVQEVSGPQSISQEIQKKSLMEGVSLALPALPRALKLQKRAEHIGFDWLTAGDVIPKIREELDELTEELEMQSSQEKLEDELGDLLFSCVNLARKLNIDPEHALRRSNRKFAERFQQLEAHYQYDRKHMESVSLEELEAVWQQVKQG